MVSKAGTIERNVIVNASATPSTFFFFFFKRRNETISILAADEFKSQRSATFSLRDASVRPVLCTPGDDGK